MMYWMIRDDERVFQNRNISTISLFVPVEKRLALEATVIKDSE